MARASKDRDQVRLNYKDAALKLLFKYPRPSKDDVYRHLCRLDHCPNPDGQCNYMFGPLQGLNCRHVTNVKSIVDNLSTILDDTFDIQ